MSTGDDDPVVARRRLKTELRQARKTLNRTQQEVARAMDWSTAKLIRIEAGESRITQNDLKVLLDYYEIREPERVASLLDLARKARSEERWTQLYDVTPPGTRRYLSYESSASIIRNYQPLLVPGLLQTEEYASAVLRYIYELPDPAVETVWEARQSRQRLHERARPPAMYFIVDETVIRRPIGGPRVMRRQLERLGDHAAEPHITLQVMPLTAGAHPGLTSRFVYIEFADPHDEDVLYLEEPDQIVREDPEQTGRYLDRFFGLQEMAAPPERTGELLARAIAEMEALGA
jgi:transcriptional regulator with XRE-family HTH domain